MLLVGFLWHVIENQRGRSAWARAEAYLAEQGIPTTLTEALEANRPVVEGANFCRLPMIAALRLFTIHPDHGLVFDEPQLVREFDSLQLPLNTEDPPDFGSITLLEPVDLQAWADWLRPRSSTDDDKTAPEPDPANHEPGERAAAQAILDALSSSQWLYQSLVEAALHSGHAAFPPYLEGDESLPDLVDLALPEISRILHVGDAIHIRGLAELALDNPDAALDAILVLQRLGEALRSGPALIHWLNAGYLDEACLHLVWDGLRRSQWSPDHLQSIRELLSRIRPVEDLHRIMVVELNATVIVGCDFFKDHRGKFAALSGGGREFHPNRITNPPAAFFWQIIMPRGWLDQNKAHGARLLADHGILPPREGRLPERVDPAALDRRPYQMFSSLILGTHLESVLAATEAAAWLALADTAVALHQFELTQDRAARSLSDLVSAGLLEQIPVDPWSRERAPLEFQPGTAENGGVWRLRSAGVDPDKIPHAAHRPGWSAAAPQ